MSFSQMLEILKKREKGVFKSGKNVSISYVLVSTGCRTHVAYAILIYNNIKKYLTSKNICDLYIIIDCINNYC